MAPPRPPSSPFAVAAAELWSVPRPYLYTLAVVVTSPAGAVLDSRNETIGIRDVKWTAESGLVLNSQAVKMRGFCNHENFGAIGAALPARVDLLRLQQLRGVGGNAWRTSHNAPEPALLALTDRMGVVVMDENRVFATTVNCPGCSNVPVYAGDELQDMADMVSRDKLHASIMWWSFCNEAGCGNGAAQPATDFRSVAYAADGSRAVGANMGWISPITRTAMSDVLDVMGFSHANANDIAKFRASRPDQPVVSSECCSCETQRGEDGDLPHSSDVFFNNEQSGCMAEQSQVSNGVSYNAGTCE